VARLRLLGEVERELGRRAARTPGEIHEERILLGVRSQQVNATMAMMNDTRGDTPKITKGKICDMIAEWTSKSSEPWISFEYFPPKTPEGVEKLHKVIDTMAKQDPLFMDFTWGAGGTTSELTLDLSKESQTRHDVMVNMRTPRPPPHRRQRLLPAPLPVRCERA
jgi:hypothetical protein